MINKDIVQDRVLKLLYEEPSLVLALKEKYVTDEIWKFCIEREPALFEQMKHPSIELCNYAVSVDGYNLKYIRSTFNYIKITEKMVYVAVNNCASAILFVPPKLLSTGLKELAFDKDPSLMINYDDIRPEYIRKKLDEDPAYLKYIRNADENLICDVLIRNPNMIVYFDTLTPKMTTVLKEYHPNVFELYSKFKG